MRTSSVDSTSSTPVRSSNSDASTSCYGLLWSSSADARLAVGRSRNGHGRKDSGTALLYGSLVFSCGTVHRLQVRCFVSPLGFAWTLHINITLLVLRNIRVMVMRFHWITMIVKSRYGLGRKDSGTALFYGSLVSSSTTKSSSSAVALPIGFRWVFLFYPLDLHVQCVSTFSFQSYIFIKWRYC